MAEIAKGRARLGSVGLSGSDVGSLGPTPPATYNKKLGLAARMLTLLVVVSSVAWLVAVRADAGMEETYDLSVIAQHMLDGETFPPELLIKVDGYSAPVVEARLCDFAGLQNLAILRVARVETAIRTSDDADAAERRLNEAADAATRSLACNPASTISWTILAWIEFVRDEDASRLRSLLRMSYQTGPYEGWALVRRTEILLHILPTLDESSVVQLRNQLSWLLSISAVDVLAEQYMNGGPQQKDFLREVLLGASERDQKRVADVVWNNGGDIKLPLVEPRGSRPWK